MPPDNNPFSEEDVNPFANAASPKIQLPLMSSSPTGFNNRDEKVGRLAPGNDPKKKEKDIAAWEADLKKREQEIKRREDALSNAGFVIEEKNWPPFFPVIHHDIAKEIPINCQKMQYMAFGSWLGVKIFLLAAIYALSGSPLAYVLWYKPLYIAMRTDRMMHFLWFFLVYLVHVIFCILASVAPPIIFEGKSLTGFIAALDTLSDNALVGIFYIIGSCLFSLETLLSIMVLQKIYLHFRGNK
ncbi:secretory carrier-associated membrane protein 6-like isoform X2 [Asparagus officinalis]|uniref:secretory carrier-associated membrane protein 6-like isoform X2 n=1 Tax=Asparagus officinalis TaxID=4686 RepID=UPI00098E244F|nr:secretory carrier-associated membrane protein 6-like isoform X2 [Asparagus officinalis]